MDLNSIADALSYAATHMDAAIVHLSEEFGTIRTGRANPGLLTKITVEYYGTQTPIQQLAGFAVPEPRILLISPYDRTALNDIEKAIRDSDLGLNPANDGNVIRCVFPELTAERRKEFTKLAKHRSEEARVAIRNVRRHAKDAIGKLDDDGKVGTDEAARGEKKLEDITSAHIKKIDEALAHKEAELLEV